MAIATVAFRNTMAAAYATANPYVGLFSALTLSAATSVGATSATADLSVVVGDSVVFDKGQGTEESRLVTAVSGLTFSFSAASFAHASGALVCHIPAVSGNGHEVAGGSYARVASAWGTATNSTVISASTSINVPISTKVGSVGLFSASTAGTQNDVASVIPQSFAGGAGTYAPTCTYIQG